MPSNPPLDLTLYLVTDSTKAILGDADLVHVVEEALTGGVTIVQYRDKYAETGKLIETATKLHELTQKHGVSLLINDRVDVCQAVGAEGVHLGQDDMGIETARKILGEQSIIGITASSIEEAKHALEHGASYLGIGTMFATPTKQDTKSIIGTAGTRQILDAIESNRVPCIAIGSINAPNVQRVLHQSTSDKGTRLNGVAVVSAIMASKDPRAAARSLRDRIDSSRQSFYSSVHPRIAPTKNLVSLVRAIPGIVKKHVDANPLCHNMTNLVVQNFAANVCLATGSSPIMSNNGLEAADLARFGGGLVINMGTVTPERMNNYLLATKAYNAEANPILFDPVGGGATSIRREAVKKLMANSFFDVIKGNEGEIKTVFGTAGAAQRGVDSGPSASTPEEKAEIVKALAGRERCIVLMTGATDFLSDGTRIVAIKNGSPLLAKITGSGCALGSTIASYVAVYRDDKILAALAAILHYEIAAERASARKEVRGPGSFIPAFLDELSLIGQEASEGNAEWFGQMAKIEVLDI